MIQFVTYFISIAVTVSGRGQGYRAVAAMHESRSRSRSMSRSRSRVVGEVGGEAAETCVEEVEGRLPYETRTKGNARFQHS